MDILERMKIIAETTSADWPTESIDWEYREAVKEIERLRANSVARCEWIEDETGIWETECGNAFEIIEGTPAENHFKFCTYCGGALVELPYRALEDE